MLEESRVLTSPILLLARAVSVVLQPTLCVVPLLILLNGLGEPSVTIWHWLLWCGVTITFTTTLPSLAFLGLLKLGIITDLNVTDRRERPLPYVLMIGCYMAGTVSAHIVGAPHRSVLFLFAEALTLTIAAFVNQRYCKISIHMLSIALIAVAVTVMFGPAALPVFVLLAGGWWARVALRAHTPIEATAGAALGVTIGMLVFALL